MIDQNQITKPIGDSKTQKTPNKIKKPEISKDSVDYLNWKKEQKKLAEIKKNVPNQTNENKTTNDPQLNICYKESINFMRCKQIFPKNRETLAMLYQIYHFIRISPL